MTDIMTPPPGVQFLNIPDEPKEPALKIYPGDWHATWTVALGQHISATIDGWHLVVVKSDKDHGGWDWHVIRIIGQDKTVWRGNGVTYGVGWTPVSEDEAKRLAVAKYTYWAETRAD